MRIVRVLLLAALICALGIGVLIWWAGQQVDRVFRPAPETIVTTSVESLREQNRLTAFMASYVAVVTSRRAQFGMNAQRTMILPGTVRYEVDLARLEPNDVMWDGTRRMLSVTLPPIAIEGPQIDLTRIRDYGSGGVLMALTDARQTLDAANRAAGQADLLRQARAPVPMALARDAARRAVARSFALPLRAAGLEASVRVRFADEPGFPTSAPEQMDRSRSLEAVLGGQGDGR